MKRKQTVQQRAEWFIPRIGTAFFPDRESKIAGTIRAAFEYAAAELWAERTNHRFVWNVDLESDSTDWNHNEPAYNQWTCVMFAGDDVVGSLGLIDFGRDNDPWSDTTTARVFEANIAIETMQRADRLATHLMDALESC